MFLANLHANEKPYRVSHKCTIQAHARIGTRYMPSSTSDTQVTRVHAGKKSYTQVCSPLSTGTLWYLRVINHRIIALSTRYNLSCVLLASSLFLKRPRYHKSIY